MGDRSPGRQRVSQGPGLRAAGVRPDPAPGRGVGHGQPAVRVPLDRLDAAVAAARRSRNRRGRSATHSARRHRRQRPRVRLPAGAGHGGLVDERRDRGARRRVRRHRSVAAPRRGLLPRDLAVERAVAGSRARGRELGHRRRGAPVRGDRLAAIPALAALRERTRPGAPRPAARAARPDAHLGRRARPRPIRRGAAWRSGGRRARRPARGRPARRGAGRGGDRGERGVGCAREAGAAARRLGGIARGVIARIRPDPGLAVRARGRGRGADGRSGRHGARRCRTAARAARVRRDRACGAPSPRLPEPRGGGRRAAGVERGARGGRGCAAPRAARARFQARRRGPVAALRGGRARHLGRRARSGSRCHRPHAAGAGLDHAAPRCLGPGGAPLRGRRGRHDPPIRVASHARFRRLVRTGLSRVRDRRTRHVARAAPDRNPAHGLVAAYRPGLGAAEPRAGAPRDGRPGPRVATGRHGAVAPARPIRGVRRRRTGCGRRGTVVGVVRLPRSRHVSVGPRGRVRGTPAALSARGAGRNRECRDRGHPSLPRPRRRFARGRLGRRARPAHSTARQPSRRAEEPAAVPEPCVPRRHDADPASALRHDAMDGATPGSV